MADLDILYDIEQGLEQLSKLKDEDYMDLVYGKNLLDEATITLAETMAKVLKPFRYNSVFGKPGIELTYAKEFWVLKSTGRYKLGLWPNVEQNFREALPDFFKAYFARFYGDHISLALQISTIQNLQTIFENCIVVDKNLTATV